MASPQRRASAERAAAQAPRTKPAPQAPRPRAGADVNEHGAATKAFLDRLQEYVTYHNNVEKMVPPLTETSNPAEIAAARGGTGRDADQAAAGRQGGRLLHQGVPAVP